MSDFSRMLDLVRICRKREAVTSHNLVESTVAFTWPGGDADSPLDTPLASQGSTQ